MLQGGGSNTFQNSLGLLSAAWPGAAGWAHGPEDTSQTEAFRRSRSGPVPVRQPQVPPHPKASRLPI